MLAPVIEAYCASYDTIPKGISTIVFKQVVVPKIESKYDHSGKENSLSLRKDLVPSELESISKVIKTYFDELKNLSLNAYNQFSLGDFEAKVDASANVQGFGIGHGVTHRLTIYGSIPLYHLKSEVRLNNNQSSGLRRAKDILSTVNPTNATGKFIKDLTMQLPETSAEMMQSLVVNNFQYKPLGKWEKDGIGDLELGLIYRLTDEENIGSAISMGLVLPTGSPDDPDSLQDISTGDGQFDSFIESMNGISFFNHRLKFDLKGRYTYQFASNKEVRISRFKSIPLTKEKQTVNEKLGNKIDLETKISFVPPPKTWLELNSSLLFNYKGKSQFKDLTDSEIASNLSKDTEYKNYWIKFGVIFSTIDLYKKRKFEIPFEVGLSGQRLISAKNSPKYDRFDLDFRFYF